MRLKSLKIHVWGVFVAVYAHASPLIECNSTSVNFGAHIAVDDVTRHFELWNRGDQPLIISEVKGCCGVSATMECTTIPPGSNTICEAIFNTRNRYGKQIKTITVSSNAANLPQLKLTLEGNLLRPVDLSPRIVRFAPQEISKRIAITNLLDQATSLQSVSTSIRGLQASIVHSNERDWIVELKKDASQSEAHISGNVALAFSFGRVNIPVIESMKSIFRVVPRHEILLPTESMTRNERLITLLSHDKKAFEIISAELEEAKGQVDIRKLRDNRWELRVNVLPSSIQPDSSLQIHTDSKTQPFISVPIRFDSP